MCKRSLNTNQIQPTDADTCYSDWLPLCGTANFVEAIGESFVVQLQVYGQNGGRWHDLYTHDRQARVELRSDGQAYAIVPGGQALRMRVLEGEAALVVSQVSYNTMTSVPETAAAV